MKTRQDRARRPEAGVTLVEMLIAVALLGFILLGIAPLFIGSVKSNYSANEYTSIHNLARDRLEQLMTLPFTDAQLAPGAHSVSDLPPTLPDPRTGVPPAPGPGAVPNPFELTYEVQQFSVSDETAVATGAPFLPTPVAAAGARFHYKRIDVTVRTRTGNLLGIGNRVSRVSGIVSNPTQTGPQEILSVAPLPTPTP